MQRVVLTQVGITNGIVHLVQIVFIVVRSRHAPQFLDLITVVAAGEHLRLGDAGIELQLVGRVQADDVTKSIVSLLLMSQQRLYLPHQKPLTGLLFPAFLVTDYLAQIGHRLLVALAAQIVVGISVVPVGDSPEVHRVALLLADDILGLV